MSLAWFVIGIAALLVIGGLCLAGWAVSTSGLERYDRIDAVAVAALLVLIGIIAAVIAWLVGGA